MGACRPAREIFGLSDGDAITLSCRVLRRVVGSDSSSGWRQAGACAGVDLSDVQIPARHADRRMTMRCDRARKNPDRDPNCTLAAHIASGT